MKCKKYSIIILILFLVSLVLAIPTFTDVNTPTSTYSDSVILEFNITEPNLKSITYNWNGTNYTLWDNNLVLAMNFDNRSSLGENDTHVFDISGNGNNGTYINGAVPTSSGKYNWGANFFKGNNYINVSSRPPEVQGITGNVTVSAWVNYRVLGSLMYVASNNKESGNNQGGWGLYKTSTNYMRFHYFTNQTGTNTTRTVTGTNALGNETWYHVVGMKNDTDISIYVNGVWEAKTSIGTPSYNNTIEPSILDLHIGMMGAGTTYYEINGTIDDVMIFNRSLSDDEISKLYKTSFGKYNLTETWYRTNQTNLSAGVSGSNPYTYFLSATDTSDNENITAITTLNVNPSLVNLTANFTTSIGKINNNFYGTNTHGRYLTNQSWIDTNNDGTLDTPANETWFREQFIDSKMNLVRADAYLYNTMSGVNSFRTTEGNKFNNINMVKNTVTYMASIGGKVLIILDQTPEFVQNKTSSYCTSADSYTSCPINDSALYTQAIQNYLNYTTSGGLYNSTVMVEVRNEPYGSTWLNNLSTDNITKATEYVKLLNVTYKAVTSVYPDMKVCTPSGLRSAPNLMNTVLSNASVYGYSTDCISIHPYADNGNSYLLSNQLYVDVNDIFLNCSAYSVDCPYIIASEWGDIESALKNTTSRVSEWETSSAMAYLGILNTYPANISLAYYQFSEAYRYNNTVYYPEYPQRWSMLSESRLDDDVYITYNITKSFATYLPSSSTIYNSDSTDSGVKIVIGKIGSMSTISITNSYPVAKNITINLTDSGITNLENRETNTVYTITNNLTNLNISGYSTLFLGEPDSVNPTFTNINNISIYTNQSVYQDINATDDVEFGYFSINWTSTFSINKTTGILTNISGLNVGDYYLNVSINDTEGNIDSKVIRISLGRVSTATVQEQEICIGFYSAGTSFMGFLGIIIIVSIVSIILFFMFSDGSEIDVTTISIMILIASVVFIFGMRIINSIGGC